MDISMSMLQWYLEDLQPKCRIEQDARCIRRLRFLFYDEQPIDPEYLYIAGMQEGISGSQYQNSHMILNRKSYMVFENIDLNELLNRVLMAFDFFNQWERDLLELKARNASIFEFLEISDKIFENPIALEDKHFRVYGHNNSEKYKLDPLWRSLSDGDLSDRSAVEEPLYDADTGELIEALTTTPRLVRNLYAGGAPVIMVCIEQNKEYSGMLTILTENAHMREIDMQLAGFLAEHVEGARELFQFGELRPRTKLLQEYLDGTLDQSELEPILKAQVPAPWRLLCVTNSVRKDSLNRDALLAKLASENGHFLASSYKDAVLLLISEDRYESALKQFAGLWNQERVNIAISSSFSELSHLHLMYSQTLFTCQESKEEPGVYYFDQYVSPYLADWFWKNPMSEYLIHPGIQTLLAYDQENETCLAQTLQVYLKLEQSSIKTSEALYIHANSMKYRLRRIKEVTGLNLTDSDELNHLRLSYLLLGRKR